MPIDRTDSGTQLEIPTIIREYSILHTIGRGPDSVVKLGVDQKNGKSFALKFMPIEELRRKDIYTSIIHMLKTLQSLEHPSILKVYDYFEVEKDMLLIVMEYCEKGTLMRVISEQHRLSESEAKSIFAKILDGICYLHSAKVVHRQLTLETILVTADGYPKITNFGFYHKLVQYQLLTTQCGTPVFAAPEVIKNQPYDGTKADMWSLGVILYSMVAGQMPWTEKNPIDLMNQIVMAKYCIPSDFSCYLVDIISSLLVTQAELRLGATDAMLHPWLKDTPVAEGRTKFCKNRKINAQSVGNYSNAEGKISLAHKNAARILAPSRKRFSVSTVMKSQSIF